jgi:hypothetical protein
LLFTAQAPQQDPWLSGALAMVAVVAAAGSAFGCALAARSWLPLRARLGVCAALLAITGITFWLGVPPRPALEWRTVRLPSGQLSLELPGPARFEERGAPGSAGGAALVREAQVRAGGLVFTVVEREEPEAGAGSEERVQRAISGLRAGGARVLEERRPAEGELLLRVQQEARRFRVRLLARDKHLWMISAGPEGVDDAALERCLASARPGA